MEGSEMKGEEDGKEKGWKVEVGPDRGENRQGNHSEGIRVKAEVAEGGWERSGVKEEEVQVGEERECKGYGLDWEEE